MRSKTRRFSGWWIWSLFAVLVMLWGVGPVQAAGEIGKTIDTSNVLQYKDMLIPALYRAVEAGEFILPTGQLNYEFKHWDKFLKSSETNVGKFSINAEGDLVDKSGKIPLYNVYGYPFPHIDPKDPQAGAKIIWNFYFVRYRQGGFHYLQINSWVDAKEGVHRYVKSDSRSTHLQGREPGQEVSEEQNPDHYSFAEIGKILEPYAMRNLNQLDFDFLNERDIIQMAYVPVIRRIRQTSGVSRSDPWMGSDGWMDTNYLWSGKNRSQTWKLVGEQTILVPFMSLNKKVAKRDPDGTMHLTAPNTKYGYNTPNWKGITYAPTNAIWVPRKCWIVEQLPKDPYYAWGLHTKWVDKETSNIWMQEVKTKAGEFRTWMFMVQDYHESANGNNNAGLWSAIVIIDSKAKHALETTLQPFDRFACYIPLSGMPMSIFTKSTLMAWSK